MFIFILWLLNILFIIRKSEISFFLRLFLMLIILLQVKLLIIYKILCIFVMLGKILNCPNLPHRRFIIDQGSFLKCEFIAFLSLRLIPLIIMYLFVGREVKWLILRLLELLSIRLNIMVLFLLGFLQIFSLCLIILFLFQINFKFQINLNFKFEIYF